MYEKARWDYLTKLDDELLIGGVVLSEWVVFVVQEADVAFVAGANLASILTAVSAIETQLRSEYANRSRERLVDLINRAEISEELRQDLHALRRYRNKWVHVTDPNDDQEIIDAPEGYRQELEKMAFIAARAMRCVLYRNQWL